MPEEQLTKTLEMALEEILVLKSRIEDMESRISDLEKQQDGLASKYTTIEYAKYPIISAYLNADENEAMRNLLLEELELSVRTRNVLIRAGYKKVGDLLEASEEDVRKVRNIGKKSYNEIVGKIRGLGYIWWPKKNQ